VKSRTSQLAYFPKNPKIRPRLKKNEPKKFGLGSKFLSLRCGNYVEILSFFKILELILGTGEKFALELFYPFSGIRFYFFSRRIGSADRPSLGDYRYAILAGPPFSRPGSVG
jgi:hypothetical protein